MSAAAIATVALYIGIYGALATALALAGKWVWHRAERQDAERSAAATFVDAFIPEAADVAAAQAALDDEALEAVLDEMVATLDDSLVHLERLRRAAS
jgi:hypothetical protein